MVYPRSQQRKMFRPYTCILLTVVAVHIFIFSVSRKRSLRAGSRVEDYHNQTKLVDDNIIPNSPSSDQANTAGMEIQKVLSDDTNRYTNSNEIPTDVISSLDAILVLGDGTPGNDKRPSLLVQQRLDYAASIVQKRIALNLQSDESHLSILCFSGGTSHMSNPVGNADLPIWEATLSAGYLMSKYPDLDPSLIYTESSSFDTIGNAFFSRSTFTNINGWRNLLVITSDFQVDHAELIFEWIFGLDSSRAQNYALWFLALESNRDVPEIKTIVERAKEQLNEANYSIIPRLRSMKAVWSYLAHEHDFYTAQSRVKQAEIAVKA